MPMFKPQMKLLLFIAMAVLILGYNFFSEDNNYVKLDAATSEEMEESTELNSKTIYVYVTGAVNKPGMVELESKKEIFRVADAVNACGGLLPTADIDNFNMADTINDGQHIRVPEKIVEKTVESQDVGYSSNEQSTYINRRGSVINNVSSNNGGIVNINTAGLEELQTLNGIGPKMAERIIEYRQTNGAFKSIEEIQNVKGIGPKKFEKMKDHLRI